MAVIEWLLLAGAIAASLAGVGAFLRWIYRAVKKMEHSYEELMQLPEFKTEVLGELRHNGGTSLKDEVVQTRKLLEDHIRDGSAHGR